MASERDPLIPRTESPQPISAKKTRGVGPMEISRSTRYGILAGIWAANFLSVCNVSRTYLKEITQNLVSILRTQSLNSTSHKLLSPANLFLTSQYVA